jgi:tetratricopeptide (TPR) repeat protein
MMKRRSDAATQRRREEAPVVPSVASSLCRFVALLLLLVTGCATEKHQKQAAKALVEFYSGDFDGAAHAYKPLAEKTDEDFVLNNVRLGTAYLMDYNLNDAEAAFLRAYEVINSVGVNNGGRSVGAVLVDEKIKIWKGEPFERAMANYYLGLIYYMRGDYNNARAAFENALFKLRDYDPDKDDGARKERLESNFVLAYVMLGKCFQRLDRPDLARANFAKAHKLRPDLQNLLDYSWNESSNVLLVVEVGYGPRKVTTYNGAIAGFAPTPKEAGPVPLPTVLMDGRPLAMHQLNRPTIDLLAMAQDRKWQDIDTIRTIKSTVGKGMMVGGGVMIAKGAHERGSRQRTDLMVGAGLLLTGALLEASSQADVRQWEILPRTVFLLPLRLPPGRHDLTIEFPGDRNLRQTWLGVYVPKRGEATYLFRVQRFNEGPFNWPPKALVRAGEPLPSLPMELIDEARRLRQQPTPPPDERQLSSDIR